METNELIVTEKINAIQVFTYEGVDPLIKEITQKVREFQPDISTPKGRKEVASLANRVARSKTLLDGLGKTLVQDWKTKSKIVDESRKKIREELDKLKVEVRAPLTEWEQAAEKKKAELEKVITNIIDLGMGLEYKTAIELQERLDQLGFDIDFGDDEFKVRAAKAMEISTEAVKLALTSRKKYEAEQIELEKLRKENAARDKKEHEDRIARDAKEKAEREAKQKADQEKERVLHHQIKAKAKADDEKRKIQEEKTKAIEAKKLAEQKAKDEKQRRIDAEKKAKADKATAVEKAKRDAKEEQERLKQLDLDNQKKREADLKHRKKINNDALNGIANIFIKDEFDSPGSKQLAKRIVEAIAMKKIPHVRIEY